MFSADVDKKCGNIGPMGGNDGTIQDTRFDDFQASTIQSHSSDRGDAVRYWL
jgi:hypothetical protein